MKASESNLLSFLKKSTQFVIPIYQRTYSWTEKECRQLWNDVLKVGSQDNIKAHFIGSIVYIEKGLYQISNQSPLLVIDGQQRLTTVTLLIAAIVKKLNSLEDGSLEPLPGFSALKLKTYYLLNDLESGEGKYKLLLSQTDKDSLISIVSERPAPLEQSIRVYENFNLFSELLDKNEDSIKTICSGLSKLLIVDVALTRDQDNPQLIFESMNSTGKELSQADLIRNYVLMGLEHQLQSRLYEDYWRPMERDFGQESYSSHFDKFMRHYLTVKNREIPNVGDVYEAFKDFSSTSSISSLGIEGLVKDIRNYSLYYCAVALNAETDKDLKFAFQDLKELNTDVSYPLLLELYADFKAGTLTKDDFSKAIRFIESYVFRRAVCAIPTNSMNKTFATIGKNLNKEHYLESLQSIILLLPSYRRFPTDEEFQKALQTRDLYNFRSRSYWLRRFENFGRKERVPVNDYTIEHILPQNKDLSPEWKRALGEEWEKVQNTWLHTLGNLTLTGYNSEYSDKPFKEKRDMEGGFKNSPLKLNNKLGIVESWNEEEIRKRAAELSMQLVIIWPYPLLTSETLARYQKKTEVKNTYSIENHPHLLHAPNNELFETLRKEIKLIDACVTEEFLKLYVAYKAETNFVDIVPQAKKLLLTLNMTFADIDDPKGICKNVAGYGRWGNGEVQVALNSLDDLPYVMGLIRQSFDRQILVG